MRAKEHSQLHTLTLGRGLLSFFADIAHTAVQSFKTFCLSAPTKFERHMSNSGGGDGKCIATQLHDNDQIPSWHCASQYTAACPLQEVGWVSSTGHAAAAPPTHAWHGSVSKQF
jgi:hypothetical protein